MATVALINGDDSAEFPDLIVTAYKNPLAKIPNTTAVLTGLIEVDCLDILSNSLAFTYEIVTPKNGFTAGTLRANGSWSGVYGQLQRKEVDMCISLTSPSPETNEFSDFSVPVLFDDTSIVVPFPQMKNFLLRLVDPFQNEVWLAILVSSIVVIFSIWFIDRISSEYLANENNLQQPAPWSYWLAYKIRMTFNANQSFQLKNHSWSFRVAVASILLPTVVINNAYLGTYISMTAVPMYDIKIRSIEDIATNPNIRSYVNRGSPTQTYLESATDMIIGKIGNQLKENPELKIVLFSYDDVAKLVKDNYVLIVATSSAGTLIQQSYDKNKKCLITLAEKAFYSRTQCISYPKNSRLVHSIDRKLLLMHQSGLILHSASNAMKWRNPCGGNLGKSTTGSKQPMKRTLNEVLDIFSLLGGGMFLSLVIFIIELIIFKISSFILNNN